MVATPRGGSVRDMQTSRSWLASPDWSSRSYSRSLLRLILDRSWGLTSQTPRTENAGWRSW
jgi:hypothetical protein